MWLHVGLGRVLQLLVLLEGHGAYGSRAKAVQVCAWEEPEKWALVPGSTHSKVLSWPALDLKAEQALSAQPSLAPARHLCWEPGVCFLNSRLCGTQVPNLPCASSPACSDTRDVNRAQAMTRPGGWAGDTANQQAEGQSGHTADQQAEVRAVSCG